MKKLTDREIERLLSARGRPEPPEGLADRIKAEIPEVLQVGGTGLEPENVRTMPPRSAAFRPLWLIAASLLVVVGAGFMAVRLLGPSEDLARRIALNGVTVIEDVVVTVPERGTGEKEKLASAMPVAKSTTKGERPVAPSKARGISKDGSAAARRIQPAAQGEPRETGGVIAAGAPHEPAAAMPQSRVTEDAVIPGHPEVLGEARSVAAADTMGRAAAPPSEAAGSIVVMVQDNVGKPVVGASVQLERGDRPRVSGGSRETGADGAATFCCVAPGRYRVCSQLPGYLAATGEFVVTSGTRLNVPLILDRPPIDGKEHSWICPTPRPPASR